MANSVNGDSPDALKQAVDGSQIDVADACRQILFEANPMARLGKATEASSMPPFGDGAVSAALPSRYFEQALAQLTPTSKYELSMSSRFTVGEPNSSRSTAFEQPNNVQQVQQAISKRNTMLG